MTMPPSKYILKKHINYNNNILNQFRFVTHTFIYLDHIILMRIC